MSEIEDPERAVLTLPRSKWRKSLLIGGLILVCPALAFVYFIISSNKELREAIAEADRLDPGWRIPELEEKRAVIRAEENSGLILMTAKGLRPANWPWWDYAQFAANWNLPEEELRALQGFWDLDRPVRLDERQTKALREELRRAGPALEVVRKVADLPRGRYPIKYSKDIISTFLPWAQDTRSMAGLLAYDVLLRAQDEDVDGALTSCRGILNFGRSFGDEPTLISMDIRMILDRLAAQRVERTLAQGQPSEAALSVIQHRLEEEAEEPLFLIAARGERGMVDGAMQAIQDGDLDLKYASSTMQEHLKTAALLAVDRPAAGLDYVRLLLIPGMAMSIRATLLKQNNQFVEIAKLPVEQQVGRIKELQAATEELPALARPFSACAIAVAAAFHRQHAELRCAAVMVAVERYRLANNRWPDALTDLVPAYLPKVPLDPFDGAPLRYRRLGDGVVIYSVGPDGEDNGGKLDKNPTKEGTDLGFRLWDVLQRRQPPKPPAQEADHERD